MKIRVLLDACVPQSLRQQLAQFEVETARFVGLDQHSDTELLNVIEHRFDVLVTLDRNLQYQHKIAGRSIAVVVVRIADQTPASYRTVLPAIRQAIEAARPGTVSVVGP